MISFFANRPHSHAPFTRPASTMAAGLVLLSFLAGCATKEEGLSSLAPPAISSQVPTDYEQIGASKGTRPEWIDTNPEDRGGMHFLVGLSEHHASERAAREDAMRHAREQYAQYTGVDVSLVDKVISSLHGVSSDVFDPTVSGTGKSTHSTDARVSRIKAKEWYWVQYKASKKGLFRGNVYKYWVLVTVPVDEYQRVQELKRKWAEEEAQALGRQEAEAEAAIGSSLARCQQTMAAIRQDTAAGSVLAGLRKVQDEWNLLYGDIERFSALPAPYPAKTGRLKQAQAQLTAQVATIRGALYIDSGRLGSFSINTGGGENSCAVWLWTRSGNRHAPVSGMPLVMTDAANQVRAQAISTPTGKAEFRPASLSPGQYRIAIDTSSPSLGQLNQSIREALGLIENRTFAAPAKTDLKGAAQIAVQKLFDGPSLEPLPVSTVTVGSVTYGETMQGSSFAHTLKQLFQQSLTSIEGLRVVEPKKRNAAVVARAATTRGIGLTSGTAAPAPALGSASMQAYIDGAQAAIETTYSIHGNEIWVSLNLKQAGTDVLLATSAAVIDRRTVPLDIMLVPATFSPASPAPVIAAGSGSIALQLTSHLGDGQTYTEGESISFFVSMDQDAYLLLVYEDAEQNLIQILPNEHSGSGFYRAGNYIEIPNGQDRFAFDIKPPFGLEKVWAFAASRPFPALRGQRAGNGLLLLNDSLASILRTVRAFGKSPGVRYGEKQTSITTVAHRGEGSY